MDIEIVVRTYATSSTPSTVLTTIQMEELIDESFEMHSSLCDDEFFHYGGCVASKLKFVTTKMTYLDNGVETPINWKNVTLEVKRWWNNHELAHTLGIFYGDKYTEIVNHTRVEVVAYDAMYLLCNVDMTEFYQSMCQQHSDGYRVKYFLTEAYTYALQFMPYDYNPDFALVLDMGPSTGDSLWWKPTAQVYNSSLERSEAVTILSGTIKMGTLLKGICEVLGYNAYMQVRDGDFPITYPRPFTYLHLINVTSTEHITFNLQPTEYRDFEYSSFDTTPFTNVRFGAYGELFNANNSIDKVYGITGNWCANAASQFSEEDEHGVLHDDLEVHAVGLLDLLSQFTYRPYSFTTFADKAFEDPDLVTPDSIALNTKVNVITPDNNTYSGIVMQRDIKGIVAASITYTCLGTEDYFAETDFGTYNSDNERITELSGKVNRGELATVATSGNYNDLSNKPSIPSVGNGTLTIQKNGTNVATFTANQSGNATANISVPTKTSDITNDSGFITSASVPTSANYLERGDWWVSGSGQNIDDITSGIHFVYTNHGAPVTGTLIAFSGTDVGGYPSSSYCWQMILLYTNGTGLYVRNRNGDNGTWGSWRRIARADEIPSSTDFVKTSAPSAQIIVNSHTGQYVVVQLRPSYTGGQSVIGFQNHAGTQLGYLGVNGSKRPIFTDATGDHEIAIKGAQVYTDSFTPASVYPTDQAIVANGTAGNSTSVQNAPGIGFHIPQVTWAQIKMLWDASFRFYNNTLTAYVPIYAAQVYSNGNRCLTTADSVSWSGGTITSNGNAYSSSSAEIGWRAGFGSTAYLALTGGKTSGKTGLLDVVADTWVLEGANNTSGYNKWLYHGKLASNRFQCGTLAFSAAGSNSVTFSGAFGGVPIVSLTVQGNSNVYVRTYSLSASAMYITVSGACTVHWMAYYNA